VLDLGQYGAFIFDLDGTLLNSEPQHVRAFSRAMQEVANYSLSPDDEREFTGNTSRDLALALAQRHQLKFDIDELVQRKFDILYESFRTEFFPGARQFLDKWRGAIPLAIASNSPRDFVEHSLGEAGVLAWFDAVTTIDDVALRKPDPEMILLTMRHLDQPAAHILVFEDSGFGLDAARQANCRTVLVKNPGNTMPEHIPANTPVMTWHELLHERPDMNSRLP